ncbi:MAG: TonB-dependent receptor, partial [Melioribacteraceae bacterium]|nr:TonB-dependent receptor [Melioribacteraceae bacterium]
MINLRHQVLYLFIFFPLALIAQEYSISGVVTDKNSNPISYANIVVLKAVDSSLLTGSISDEDGLYNIDNLQTDDYIIKISFLGFKTRSESISLNKNISLNITLFEEEEELGEVEILAQKPKLTRGADRLIFNIENTSLTEGSIWDVIRSTPGVLLINDEVLVKNSPRVIYLINDKRVHLSGSDLQQLLSGSAADAVKSVEVITNPPAKYDAEGDAVLNIKMSKNLATGYNGNIYGNFTQGVYPRYSAGSSHFFKSKRTKFFLGYGFNKLKVNRINKEAINFIENNSVVGNWDTDIDRNTRSENHNANLNFDYFINDNNTFSISGNASIMPYWKRKTNSFTQAVDSTFSSVNNTDDDKLNFALNADYVYESEEGNKLSFNVHQTNYDYERQQRVNTIYTDDNFNSFTRSNSFSTEASQDIQIYSGQIDLEIPSRENGLLELGVKTSSIDS